MTQYLKRVNPSPSPPSPPPSPLSLFHIVIIQRIFNLSSKPTPKGNVSIFFDIVENKCCWEIMYSAPKGLIHPENQ